MPLRLSVKYLCIILAVVTIALYANTLRNGYVMDDGMVLKENTLVREGVKAIPKIFSTPRGMGSSMVMEDDFYRPLSMAMFAVEVQVFGMSPGVGHFFNILAFAGCVLMLFFFLSKLFNEPIVAFVAAFLFAIHPIHTEVVANIKSRDELLCYFFGFWSLNLFMNHMKQGRVAQLIGGIVTLFLAYLSKETVISFLVIIPLLFFFYQNENRRRAVMITAGALVVTGIFLLIRTAVLNKYHANESTAVLSFIDNALVGVPDGSSKIATAFMVLGKYLCLMFVPYPLLCNYSFGSIPFVGFGNVWVLASMAAYGFLLVFSVYRLVNFKKDMWAFGILFYLEALALFSNIPFLVGAEMADRFVFFASTGFCIVVALAVKRWVLKGKEGTENNKVAFLLLPLLLVFGSMTVMRNSDWKDEYTLFKTDLARSPNDARLNQWLGTEIAQNIASKETNARRRQELDGEAMSYFRRALELYPGFAEAAAQMGWIMERNNRLDSAVYYNKMALNIDPNNADAVNNTGSLYYSQGKYREAAAMLEKAIALDPKLKTAYVTLGNCYVQMRDYAKAIAMADQALVLDPDNTDALQVAGNAYMGKQKYTTAEVKYKQALEKKPNDVTAINGLGVVYLNARQLPEAEAQFKKAISLSPQYAKAYSNLGRTYYLEQQYAAAIDAVNKSLAADPKNGGDFAILALCYQKTGNMELAVKYEAMAKQVYPNFKLQ